MATAEWNHADGRVGLRRITGIGERIERLREEIRQIGPLDSTVLLTGETGTGKSQVARALHELSSRAERPFVHVDCAALSPNLIESELFGHERGAFTNAVERRVGRFELAGQGTLLLDEIGDLAASLQAKMLRVLEDREFERVGGIQTLRLRARVIAATSRELGVAVEEGHFRADLYFRLNVFRLHLPPLRDRHEDLPVLVAEGLRGASARLGFDEPEATEDFLAGLESYRWPGNVRELLNLLERAVAKKPGGQLDAKDVEALLGRGQLTPQVEPRRALGPAATLADLVEEIGVMERREILEALAWSGGNVSAAARRLRIPRSTLRHRMQKMASSGESAS